MVVIGDREGSWWSGWKNALPTTLAYGDELLWSFLSMTEKMVKFNSLFGVGRGCKTVCERF